MKTVEELEKYRQWIHKNTDDIVSDYCCQLDVFPDDIYEGVLDDDYPDAEDRYMENLDIEYVPPQFILKMYEER